MTEFGLMRGVNVERRFTYLSYRAMKRRCADPKHHAYKHYGARGITVCQRWLDSFDAFLEDMGYRPQGRTLDRISNDGNYEPSNCRWATQAEQRANQLPPFSRTTPPRTGIYAGISKNQRGRYRAYYYETVDGKRRQFYIGAYATADEARDARQKALALKGVA